MPLPYNAKIGGKSIRYEYDALGRQIYMGICNPGKGRGQNFYAIMKSFYDDAGNPTKATRELWAGGECALKFRWDQRATYTYA